MFTLARGAWSEVTKKQEFFIAIVGLDGVGKTTYVEQIRSNYDKHYKNRPRKITSTVGLNMAKIDVESCVLVFWDLGGDSELRGLWNSYLERCDAVIFFIDFLDKSREAESLQELATTVQNCNMSQHMKPLMVVVNKFAEEYADAAAFEKTFPLGEAKGMLNEKIITKMEKHKSDSAIFYVETLQNLNVRKSMMWIIKSLNQKSN